MTKKLIMMVVTAALGVAMVAFADPVVTDITAKQRYPWNGLVDIGCKVSGIEGTINGYTFVVVAVDKDSGKEYTATHCTAKHDGSNVPDGSVAENGDYELLWDARADMGQVVIERMAMRITLEPLAVSVGKVQLWEGGPYWADRNIGADKPEDYGLYFQWGDTMGYRPSADGTFSFERSNYPTYGKDIATLQSWGWIVSKDESYVLAPSHDAAHVKWGGSWRMPTDQELSDLCSKCDWTWTTTLNGVKGYVVYGRGAYASNSIFLPAVGNGWGTSIVNSGYTGYYWSSSPLSYSSDARCAAALSTDMGHHFVLSGGGYDRNYGLSIRPVQGFAE